MMDKDMVFWGLVLVGIIIYGMVQKFREERKRTT